uniref:Uncharacterized protein n=1 Tax=Heterorhabditis bacteriophora TaxID=37862 RepID=A0A1I7WSR3_HETBA
MVTLEKGRCKERVTPSESTVENSGQASQYCPITNEEVLQLALAYNGERLCWARIFMRCD